MVRVVACNRGAALLEVVVSVGLLVFGLAMVGLQINAGIDAARHSDIATRAVMLADTKFTELRAGILRPDEYEQELKGDFGLLYPGFTWRVEIVPAEIEHLYFVTLEVGYNPGQIEDQLIDPDYEIDIEDEGTRIVRTAYRLWAEPPDVDLERDFGLTEEEIEAFMLMVEGLGQGEGEGEEGLDESLADFINELLAFSEDGVSFDPRMLSQLPPEDFMKLSEMLELMVGRSDFQALEQKLGKQGFDAKGGGRDGRDRGDSFLGDRAGRDKGDSFVGNRGGRRGRDRDELRGETDETGEDEDAGREPPRRPRDRPSR